jgi:hypothetical protein
MVKGIAASWVRQNCRFAGGLAGTPHGDRDKGTLGFSRIFDLTCHFMESQGLKSLSKAAHVATFAFSKDAPEEHQVRVSWGGRDDPGSKSVTVRIVDNDPNKKWLGWADSAYKKCSQIGKPCEGEGDYFLTTDSLHAYPPANWQTNCYSAFHELEKRVNRQLDPRARWSMSLRFLPSTSAD